MHEDGNGFGAPRVISTPESNNRAATWRDFIVLTSVGAVLFGVVATQAGGRSAAIATGAYPIVAFVALAYRYDARETASEAASQERTSERAEPRHEAPQPTPQTAPLPPSEEAVAGTPASEEQPDTVNHRNGSGTFESQRGTVTVEQPQASVNGQAEHNGMVQEEEASREAAVATQTISPALYGTGVVDEASGEIGQVNLLETGLNVLAKENGSGAIDEVNEGMEVFTGLPRDDLLGTDVFSYFTEPDRTKGWFMEALQGSFVRDKEVEFMHQEGETTPLTYNVIASTGNGRTGGVPLCRYREG